MKKVAYLNFGRDKIRGLVHRFSKLFGQTIQFQSYLEK